MHLPSLPAEAAALLHPVSLPVNTLPTMAERILGTRFLVVLLLDRLLLRHAGDTLREVDDGVGSSSAPTMQERTRRRCCPSQMN